MWEDNIKMELTEGRCDNVDQWRVVVNTAFAFCKRRGLLQQLSESAAMFYVGGNMTRTHGPLGPYPPNQTSVESRIQGVQKIWSKTASSEQPFVVIIAVP
jgi:hypothetical protein